MIDSKKTTILLIDDNPVNNKLVASILMPQGYQLYIANNGQSGIELAARILPDIILLDIMMPNINGFEVCRHLKNEVGTQDIPVIFITADTSSETQIRSFQQGGSDFITKPIVDVVLIERIRHQIKLSHHRQRLERLNNYHEIAEYLSNMGFWAYQSLKRNETFTFSKQFGEILDLDPETPEYGNFNLDALSAVIAASNDSATRNGHRKNWTASISQGGMFDEVCHCDLRSGKKFIRIWAQFKKESSDVISAFGVIQDITQVINTESELATLKSKFSEITTRQHMVEANTQLAHELNQPLAAININISYIRQIIESMPPAAGNKICEVIGDIESDVARATNIVQNIRRILKKEPVIIRTFDLNILLDETIHIFNRDLLQNNIHLIYEPKEESCMVRSDRTGLQQVIVNLLKNAIEAISSAVIKQPVIELRTVAHKKGTNIFICDNGPGIKASERENIFRQYYTSKQGNTGMGLAICKALMEEVDGDVLLAPPPAGRNTCFKVIINNR